MKKETKGFVLLILDAITNNYEKSKDTAYQNYVHLGLYVIKMSMHHIITLFQIRKLEKGNALIRCYIWNLFMVFNS